MNRGTGAGLMAFSVVLVVVGAILDFAVTATAKGFSVHTVGIILLSVGIALFVVSVIILAMASTRRTTVQEDIRSVPGGQYRSVEERDNLAG
jgi:uncharacterized membrane protein YidH (DUF202 family)